MSSGSGGDDFSEINVTPLTDVFLILFLIMVVIAPVMNETSLPIEPPKAQNGKASDTQGKVINLEIAANGIMAINNKKLSEAPIDPDEVADRVSERLRELRDSDMAYREAPLNVIADAETRQKYVVGALDAAAGLEIKKLNIVTVTRDK